MDYSLINVKISQSKLIRDISATSPVIHGRGAPGHCQTAPLPVSPSTMRFKLNNAVD